VKLPSAISFDLSDWTQIDLSGSACRSFFHNFCTNDINGLTPGHTCEAFICDVKGRVLGHVLVFAGEHSLRLISVPGQSPFLTSHLGKYLLDADVSITDVSADEGLLCLCGTAIAPVLTQLFGTEVSTSVGEWKTVSRESASFRIGGTDIVNLPAILISGLRRDLENLLESIPNEVLAAGTPHLFELLRIEARFPKVGVDIGPENIAQEATRTKQAISFSKGCYLGQEPIARLDAMGHTNKELRGLNIESDKVSPGDAIVVEETVVGKITSVAPSLAPERQVALGTIRVRHADPGTAVRIRTAQGEVPAIVFRME